MGKGQDWCCICDGPIASETSVGAGSGAGDGRDGDFAHRRCYDLRDAIKRGGSPTELAASLATFVRDALECQKPRTKTIDGGYTQPPVVTFGGFEQRFDGDELAAKLDRLARQLAPKEAGYVTVETFNQYEISNLIADTAHHIRRLKKSEDEREKTTKLARGSWNRLAQHFKLWTQADGDDTLRQTERHVAGILIEIPRLLATYKIDQKG